MTMTDPPGSQTAHSDDLSRVRYAPVNGVDVAYETFGDTSRPAILLVMGLGTQMIAWPDDMCALLAEAGHHVIRFDNRDVGLSTHLEVPAPSLADMLLRRDPPYAVADMAGDALALLDHLEVPRAHVVGASMGGFISQTMALAQPDRVLSLSLVMTSTGSRRVGRPHRRWCSEWRRAPLRRPGRPPPRKQCGPTA